MAQEENTTEEEKVNTKKCTIPIYCRCNWCGQYFSFNRKTKYCSRSCKSKYSYQFKKGVKIAEKEGFVSNALLKSLKVSFPCNLPIKNFKKLFLGEMDFLVIKNGKTTKKGDVMIVSEVDEKTGNMTGRQLSRHVINITDAGKGYAPNCFKVYFK